MTANNIFIASRLSRKQNGLSHDVILDTFLRRAF